MATTKIIDADGHVAGDRGDGLAKFVPAPFTYKPFPPLDHLHSQNHITPPGSFRPAGAREWIEFMNDVGIEQVVLYTTGGLGCGKIKNRAWAITLIHAYNEWLAETYTSQSPRLKGMALVPLQEPEAAVEELRWAVTEAGMCGAMLPSNGIQGHLGSKQYWPIYAEAERLGCCIGVHGGCHDGFGLDEMNAHVPVHALGHPWGLAVSFAGMLFNRVFDRYPRLRIGFLEGGVGWLPMALERFDRSHETHTQIDPREEILLLPQDQKISDYARGLIKDGRLFVGCEGNEATLLSSVQALGSDAFMYSSDFPHEVNNEYCKEEIHEFLTFEDFSDADREVILHKNAERFYGL